MDKWTLEMFQNFLFANEFILRYVYFDPNNEITDMPIETIKYTEEVLTSACVCSQICEMDIAINKPSDKIFVEREKISHDNALVYSAALDLIDTLTQSHTLDELDEARANIAVLIENNVPMKNTMKYLASRMKLQSPFMD